MGLFDSDSESDDGVFSGSKPLPSTKPKSSTGLFADTDSDEGENVLTSESESNVAGSRIQKSFPETSTVAANKGLFADTESDGDGDAPTFGAPNLANVSAEPDPSKIQSGGQMPPPPAGLFDDSDDEAVSTKNLEASSVGAGLFSPEKASSEACALSSTGLVDDTDTKSRSSESRTNASVSIDNSDGHGESSKKGKRNDEPRGSASGGTSQENKQAITGGLDESSTFHGVSVFSCPAASKSSTADTPPMVGGAPRRLRLGDSVTVVDNPRNTDFLKPGQIGTIVEVDDMDAEDVWFSVEDAEGEIDEYCEADLKLSENTIAGTDSKVAGGGNGPTPVLTGAPAPEVTTSDVAASASGTQSTTGKGFASKPSKGLFDDSDDNDDGADDSKVAGGGNGPTPVLTGAPAPEVTTSDVAASASGTQSTTGKGFASKPSKGLFDDSDDNDDGADDSKVAGGGNGPTPVLTGAPAPEVTTSDVAASASGTQSTTGKGFAAKPSKGLFDDSDDNDDGADDSKVAGGGNGPTPVLTGAPAPEVTTSDVAASASGTQSTTGKGFASKPSKGLFDDSDDSDDGASTVETAVAPALVSETATAKPKAARMPAAGIIERGGNAQLSSIGICPELALDTSQFTKESALKLQDAERRITALVAAAAIQSHSRLLADLADLQEELATQNEISREIALEAQVLAETKSLLVLQGQRYNAELPRLSELTIAKEREDQRLAELAKQRAREDAALAATEAAAAAAEWEKVYALRLERDQAALRAAEAEAKLRDTQDSITARNETRNAKRKKRVEDENAVRQREENAAAAKAASLEALRNIAAEDTGLFAGENDDEILSAWRSKGLHQSAASVSQPANNKGIFDDSDDSDDGADDSKAVHSGSASIGAETVAYTGAPAPEVTTSDVAASASGTQSTTGKGFASKPSKGLFDDSDDSDDGADDSKVAGGGNGPTPVLTGAPAPEVTTSDVAASASGTQSTTGKGFASKPSKGLFDDSDDSDDGADDSKVAGGGNGPTPVLTGAPAPEVTTSDVAASASGTQSTTGKGFASKPSKGLFDDSDDSDDGADDSKAVGDNSVDGDHDGAAIASTVTAADKSVSSKARLFDDNDSDLDDKKNSAFSAGLFDDNNSSIEHGNIDDGSGNSRKEAELPTSRIEESKGFSTLEKPSKGLFDDSDGDSVQNDDEFVGSGTVDATIVPHQPDNTSSQQSTKSKSQKNTLVSSLFASDSDDDSSALFAPAPSVATRGHAQDDLTETNTPSAQPALDIGTKADNSDQVWDTQLVEQLIDMGFAGIDAKAALSAASGDIQAATDWLLAGGTAAGSTGDVSSETASDTKSQTKTGGLDESSTFHGVSVFSRPAASKSSTADTPPMVGGAPRRLRLGDSVTVVDNPRNTDFLKPGQIGTIVEVDDMDAEDVWFSVEDAEGEIDEYCEADLKLSESVPTVDTDAAVATDLTDQGTKDSVITIPEASRERSNEAKKPASSGLFDTDSDDDSSAGGLFG